MGGEACVPTVTQQRLVLGRVRPLPFGLRLIPFLLDTVFQFSALFVVVVRPLTLGFALVFVQLATVAAVRVGVAATLLAAMWVSPLNHRDTVFGVALWHSGLCHHWLFTDLMAFVGRRGRVLSWTDRPLWQLGCHLLQMVNDVRRSQILRVLLACHVLQNLFGTQMETRAEHLLTFLQAPIGVITCSNTHTNRWITHEYNLISELIPLSQLHNTC